MEMLAKTPRFACWLRKGLVMACLLLCGLANMAFAVPAITSFTLSSDWDFSLLSVDITTENAGRYSLQLKDENGNVIDTIFGNLGGDDDFGYASHAWNLDFGTYSVTATVVDANRTPATATKWITHVYGPNPDYSGIKTLALPADPDLCDMIVFNCFFSHQHEFQALERFMLDEDYRPDDYYYSDWRVIDGMLYRYSEYDDTLYLEAYPPGLQQTTFTLPENAHVLSYTFSYAHHLQNILVENNNPKAVPDEENPRIYFSRNGLLFEKELKDDEETDDPAICTYLVAYPAGRQEESFTVPAGISSAWSFCANLFIKNVTLPDSYSDDDFEEVFTGCANLENVFISAKNPYGIFDDNGVVYGLDEDEDGYELLLYPQGRKNSSYSVLKGTTQIDDDAFGEWDLANEALPCFINTHLQKLILPASFWNEELLKPYDHDDNDYNSEDVDCAFFWILQKLQNFEVHPDNQCFSAVQGVLYDKSKTALIAYPTGSTATTFAIPEGVKFINENAFRENKSLKNVQFPSTLQTISWDGFHSCTALQEVSFPASLKSLEEDAFYGCASLKTVTFASSDVELHNPDAFTGCPIQTFYLPDTKLVSILMESFPDATYIVNGQAVDTTGNSLTYEVITGEVIITGRTSRDAYLFIPETIEDRPVTAIADEAFEGDTALRQVYLGNVKTIGARAFANCANLTSFERPLRAFTREYSQINESHYWPHSTEFLSEAFADCDSLTSVTLQGNDRLHSAVFNGCSSLRKVIIPIANYETYIYEDGEQTDIFFGMPSCTDDFLYDDELHWTPLPQICLGTDYGIWDGFDGCPVTELELGKEVFFLEPYDFTEWLTLETVTLSSPQMGFIPEGAFASCDHLKQLSLTTRFLADIEDFAFADCESLETLAFHAENWGNGNIWISQLAFDNDDNLSAVHINDMANGTRLIDWVWECFPDAQVYFFGQPVANYMLGYRRLYQGASITLDEEWDEEEEEWIPRSWTSPRAGVAVNDLLIRPGTAIDTLEIPAEVNGFPVIALRDETICDAYDFQTLRLPDSLLCIGESNFCDIPSLASVVVPESVEAIGANVFTACDSLEYAVLPQKVTRLENGLLSYCPNLRFAVISDNIDFVGDDVFADCVSLETIYTNSAFFAAWAAKNIPWVKIAKPGDGEEELKTEQEDDGVVVTGILDNFEERLNIPPIIGGRPVKRIASGAFQHTAGLKSVTLPETIVELGENAFNGCADLVSVDLPGSLDAIASGSFANCTSLRKVRIPDSVTAIQGAAENTRGATTGAFEGCTSLTSVTIGKGVTSIASNAFNGCDSLQTVFTDNDYAASWFAENLPEVQVRACPVPFRAAIMTYFDNGLRSIAQEAELVFGFDEEASFQESALPLFPDDTPGVYSIAFVGEQGRLSTDIREFQETASWEIEVRLAPGCELNLDWSASSEPESFADNPFSMPPTYDFTFFDPNDEYCQFGLDMRECAYYNLYNDTDTTAVYRVTVTVTPHRERAQLEIFLTAGWNLIGIPFELTPETAYSLNHESIMSFDAKSQSYIVNPGVYTPGQGLWFFSHQTDTILLEGFVSENPQPPALFPGWNLLSPLFGQEGFATQGTAWQWTPQGNRRFDDESALPQPGEGYWLLIEE